MVRDLPPKRHAIVGLTFTPPSNLYMAPSVMINARSACLLCLLIFLEKDENKTLLKPSPGSLFLRFLTLDVKVSSVTLPTLRQASSIMAIIPLCGCSTKSHIIWNFLLSLIFCVNYNIK
uniref:Uncharacterized protein n=1 Tax=Glossina brevipalpis TaxID=37001 RepID=A0A1A9WM88_9MUSC